jgi:hypothetical protein
LGHGAVRGPYSRAFSVVANKAVKSTEKRGLLPGVNNYLLADGAKNGCLGFAASDDCVFSDLRLTCTSKKQDPD